MVKISNKTENLYFSLVTKLNASFVTNTRLSCFMLCLRKSCAFVEYHKNKCTFYDTLLCNEEVLNGAFWYRKVEKKIQLNSTF